MKQFLVADCITVVIITVVVIVIINIKNLAD